LPGQRRHGPATAQDHGTRQIIGIALTALQYFAIPSDYSVVKALDFIQEDAMSAWETLLKDRDLSIVIGLFVMMLLMVVVIVVASTWHRIAKDREDAALKQSMIDRGMSVEEIERVLQAKSPVK
jgi:hypothetical protein